MTAKADLSDGELLQSMLAGDEAALAALYQRRARMDQVDSRIRRYRARFCKRGPF